MGQRALHQSWFLMLSYVTKHLGEYGSIFFYMLWKYENNISISK
jgi:hypothetical protein